MSRGAVIGTVLILMGFVGPWVYAQPLSMPQIGRPNAGEPELPGLEPSLPPPLTLPPIPQPPKRDRLAGRIKIEVKRFQFEGNTVFTDEELKDVVIDEQTGKRVKDYEGTFISTEELQQIRYRLTLHYVNNGYINSGVIIPDQEVADGVIRLTIIEGKLSEIDIKDSDQLRLRERYIEGRLTLDAEPVLNIQHLQERLQLLQQNPLIDQIKAELLPGVQPGEAVLAVRIKEAKPYELRVTVANDRSPSIGALNPRLFGTFRNVTGWGDAIGAEYGLTDGSDDMQFFYSIPVSARDTVVSVSYEKTDSRIIEEPFKELDIDSQLETYAISLNYPLIMTLQRSLSLGLSLERRRSESSLLGQRFSFSPGSEDGVAKLTVVRFIQEWLDRRVNQAIAARSIVSLGLNAFDATLGEEPDGQFLAWLGQFQIARRFAKRGDQVIFRTALQLANDTLPAMERIAVGGPTTVRGYRVNQLVRDNAWISSMEYRVPVFRLPIPGLSRGPGDGLVQLAPFADFASAWNTDVQTPNPPNISSIGLGLRWEPSPKVFGYVYWGKALRNVDNPDHDLQDSGITFLVHAAY